MQLELEDGSSNRCASKGQGHIRGRGRDIARPSSLLGAPFWITNSINNTIDVVVAWINCKIEIMFIVIVFLIKSYIILNSQPRVLPISDLSQAFSDLYTNRLFPVFSSIKFLRCMILPVV